MLGPFVLLLLASPLLGQAAWNDPKFAAYRDSINNNPSRTWKAARHPGIPYHDRVALKKMLGGKNVPKKSAGKQRPYKQRSQGPRLLQSIPTTYDLRTAFPNCWSIGYIRTQGKCASCWAVAGSAALSDDYWIHYTKQGTPQQRSFSYEDTLENCGEEDCYVEPGNACESGGSIVAAFEYSLQHGTVTGENYNNQTGCKPYLINPAVTTMAATPPASSTCDPSFSHSVSYANDKFFIAGYTYIDGDTYDVVAANAQSAILTYGTIIAVMGIYYDFYFYQSGVYQVTTDDILAAHVVRIIGWGVDPATNLPYWLAANSWGTGWGTGGFFKILRGADEAYIELSMWVPFIV